MTIKVDIFASPKQPSLFPMTIPCPEISQEFYHLFYKQERRLFTLLLVILHREAVQSVLVVGFLIWLEREGYTSDNLVENILDSLSLDAINLVADEAVICLKCVEKKENSFLIEGSSGRYDISLLQALLDRKRICLEEFHENGDWIFDELSGVANDVCAKAFEDILQQFIGRGGPSAVVSPTEVVVGGGAGGYRYIGPVVPFPSYDVNKYVGFHPENAHFMLNDDVAHHCQPMVGLRGANLVVREQEQLVPPENRTIFLTFSKGYPISESEVKDYFTRIFGDFIEAIHMHEVEPDEQALYARIVACSPSIVKVVIERDGPAGKSKYNINGKHVWARRYVKKKPTVRASPTHVATGEDTTPPQA